MKQNEQVAIEIGETVQVGDTLQLAKLQKIIR
jgi:hypothetical protein